MTDPRRSAYMTAVYEQILSDLHYPIARNGDVMDVSWVKAIVGYHLVRCGWRKPNNTDGLGLQEDFDEPVIKKRKVLGPGVLEDAVTWVSTDEPDDPLADLENMSMREIDGLAEDLRTEAKRRLGLIPALPTPDPDAGWSVKPFIQITSGEDLDGTHWA